jgi:hypothetical protein
MIKMLTYTDLPNAATPPGMSASFMPVAMHCVNIDAQFTVSIFHSGIGPCAHFDGLTVEDQFYAGT